MRILENILLHGLLDHFLLIDEVFKSATKSNYISVNILPDTTLDFFVFYCTVIEKKTLNLERRVSHEY